MPTKQQCIPLTLDHQKVLEGLWKPLCVAHDLQYSEYSFANNYINRSRHAFCYIDNDPPFLRGEFKPGSYYYIPTRAPKDISLRSLSAIGESSICLFPVPEKWLDDFHKYHPGLKSCRSDTDYLFTVEKLKTFPGRALSSRRNLLTQLLYHHKMESKPLAQKDISEAVAVLDKWQEQSGQPKEKTDYFPCLDSLKYLERLGLFARIAYADGQAVGFTVGEILTPTTVQMLMAKALHAYHGLTAYLYQDFAMHLPHSIQWIDLEQDLGLPSLRRAKEAYEPDVLLPKWRVTIECL